jgi:hypothetical protein
MYPMVRTVADRKDHDMDLIAELHKVFEGLEAKAKEIFHAAEPAAHAALTDTVSAVKEQAAELAGQALADAKADGLAAAKGAAEALETVDPNATPAPEVEQPAEPDPPAGGAAATESTPETAPTA